MKINIDVGENDKLDEIYTKIMNFEQAVNKAISFAKKSGYYFVRLDTAEKQQNNSWIVKVDVGGYKREIKTVIIAASGVIVGFK